MPEGSIAGRLKRMVRIGAQALAALFAVASAPPVSAQQPQRIVAVGDLHGDFKAWQDIARAAGVMNAKGHWAGGRTVLVQMGDMTDR